VPQAMTVFIAVTQTDQRVKGKDYESIGFYLFRADSTDLKLIRPSAEMEASSFSHSRDASREVLLTPDVSYVLMPCMFHPGSIADYSLHIYSPQIKVGFSQIINPYPVTQEGNWSVARHTAGGCFNSPTWRQNPQYLLSSKEHQTVCVDLTQKVGPNQPIQFIGFYVLQASAGTQAVLFPDEDSELHTTFENIVTQRLRFEMEPGVNYVVIPCCFEAFKEGSFTLSVYSKSVVLVRPAKARSQIQMGEWRGRTSGGCINHPSWVNNPRFSIVLKETTRLCIVLEQEADADGNCKHYGGFYLAVDDGTELNQTAIVGKSEFNNGRQITVTFPSVPPNNYLLIPAPYEEGFEGEGRFTVYIYQERS